MKDTENMVEQRTADVRTVGWSLRQKEILGIVLDVIQSLRSSAHAFNLNAFSVPLINLMSYSDGNPANNTLKKEERANPHVSKFQTTSRTLCTIRLFSVL